jgi:hypothetical protein
MTLNAYAAELRLRIFEEIKAGREPSLGSFDPLILKEARTKGTPQLGTTRYLPNELAFEFIFPDPKSSSTLLSVSVTPPERIVFLPVPEWVIESIWQGDIAGSYHFESEAMHLLESFGNLLTPEGNAPLFGPQLAKRRE